MGWVFNAPDDTATWGLQIVAICLVFTVLSLITCGLRVYVRVVLINAFGADDWSIICSWVSSTLIDALSRAGVMSQAGVLGYVICSVIQTRWGLGVEQLDDMPTQNIEPFLFLQYLGSPFYVLCLFAFKFSLLLSYLRFLPNGFWRVTTQAMAVIMVLAHIGFELGFLLNCNPIEKAWDTSITTGSCIGLPFYTAFSALTICFDVIIILLPFPVLIMTKIRMRKKVAILGLFALGIFITIVQIVRFRAIQTLSNLLESANAITWSVVEANLGVITTCLPTLAPLFKYFSDRSRVGGYYGTPDARGYLGGGAGAGGVGSSRTTDSRGFALKSMDRDLRRPGRLAELSVTVRGNHSSESMDLIYDTTGIMKKTEVTRTVGPSGIGEARTRD